MSKSWESNFINPQHWIAASLADDAAAVIMTNFPWYAVVLGAAARHFRGEEFHADFLALTKLIVLRKQGPRFGAMTLGICNKTKFGCGGPALQFRDDLSRKEYKISAFCQSCQDKVFEVKKEE